MTRTLWTLFVFTTGSATGYAAALYGVRRLIRTGELISAQALRNARRRRR